MERIISLTKPRPRPRPLDDVVDDIVNALGHVDCKALVMSKDETRAKVVRAIEDSTEFFDRWDSSFSREGRATIARDAAELADLIAAVELKLKRLPDPLAGYLFNPPKARHTVMPVDDIVAATVADKKALLERLERLRMDCQRQKPPPSPTGPEQDRVKNHCAAVAFNLMKTFSRRKIVSSGGSTFNVVASLIYELLTGKVAVELERACKYTLRSRRSAV